MLMPEGPQPVPERLEVLQSLDLSRAPLSHTLEGGVVVEGPRGRFCDGLDC